MLRKILPYLLLFIAACALYWIKSHQKGKSAGVEPPSDNYPVFVRDSSNIVYTKHALCRMDCRQIDESEIREILANGSINYEKIEKSGKGVSFPLEGYTHDQQHVRIVFSPHRDAMYVVTAIDLDREWPCDCK